MFNVKNYGYQNVLRGFGSSAPKLTNFADSLANSSTTYLPIDTERSVLDRIFDALSVGTYTSAGLVRGLLPGNNVGVVEGVIDGLRAANPIGDGYERGEHTYSKVLGDIGWKPQSTAGKVAKGALGLAGDIFLDPLTYLTLGGSALVKGTGKAGMTATHATGLIEEAAKHGDDISKFASAGMTSDLAKKIITEHSASRGIAIGADELAESAEKLTRQYNKLAGVQGVASDSTLSLGNLPFNLGKKMFGDLADKSITVAKGETLQKIGDATLAPAYSKLRNNVYGSKLGKLFSTKSKLYELSKTDPSAVYEYLKSVDGVRALNSNIRVAEKSIREIGNQFNLTPDESKEVIKMMEDKSLWNTVTKAINVSDTDEYKKYADLIKGKRDNDSALLEELTSQKDMLNKLSFAKDEEIEGLKTVKEKLNSDYLSKLKNLETSHIDKKQNLVDLVHSYDESIDKLEPVNFDKLDNVIKSYDDELKSLDDSDAKLLGKKEKLADMYTSKRKDVNAEVKLAREKETSDISNTLNEYLTESKSRYAARKAGVKVETPETIDKASAVRAVSKYIFDNDNIISPVVWDSKLEDLQKLINKGTPKKVIAEYVRENGDKFLSSSRQSMFSYIAKKMEYKNWKEYYHDRMNGLVDNLHKNGDFTDEEYNLYFELKKAEKVRNGLIQEFEQHIDKYGLDKGISKYITDAANKEMMEDSIYGSGMINSTAKGGFKNTLDVQKGSWTDNDFADIAKSTDFNRRGLKTTEFDDKSLSGKAVISDNSNDRAKIVQDLTDKLFLNKGGFDLNKLNKSHLRWVNKVIDEVPKLLENTFHVEYKDLTPKQTELLYDMAVKNATKTADDSFKYDKVGQAVAEESKKRISALRDTTIKEKTAKGTRVEFMSGGKLKTGTVDNFKDASLGRIYSIVTDAGEHIDNVRMNQLTGFESSAKKLNPEELIASSDTTKDFFERQQRLYQNVNSRLEGNAAKRSEIAKLKDEALVKKGDAASAFEKQRGELTSLKDATLGELNSFSKLEDTSSFKTLTENYNSHLDNISEQIKQLEVDRESLTARFKGNDFKSIETLSNSVKGYEDLLNNQDAIESYVKTMSDLGIPVEKEQSVASIILDSYPDTKAKVIDVVEQLRKDFNKAGSEEVGIGELTVEQFEAMKNHYFPHVLTDAGKKLFNFEGDIVDYEKSFGGEFGKPFNEFGQTRNTHHIPDGKGGYITNPTVAEVNSYFKENFDHILKGNNVFSENLSDVYVARMLKHSDLMYNTEYIDEAVKGFGKPYAGEVLAGHKPVMDFTSFREHSKSYARLSTSNEVSDMVSKHLGDNVNFEELRMTSQSEAYKIASVSKMDVDSYRLLSKKIYSDKITKIVNDFVKENITDEVRETIYKGKLNEFYGSTKTEGYVDKLSYPLLEFDKSQIDMVKSATDSVVNASYDGVRKNIVKLINQNEFNANKSFVEDIAKNLDTPDQIRKSLGRILSHVDEVDAARVQRLIDKVDKIDDSKFGEFNNVQDTIVSKFNQSRKNQMIKDQSNLLTIYDKATHLIKLNQTTVLPSFHMRNKMANTFNNFLSVGSDAVDVEFQKKAWQAIKGDGNIDGVLKITKEDGSIDSIDWKNLYQKAKEYNVIDEGFYAKDLDKSNASNGLFKKLPSQVDPTDTKNFVLYSKGAKFGSLIENQDRLIHFASHVSHGMSFDEAAESVEKFLFDYSDLTAFEQNVMKRILPYYTWMRKNGALQLEMLLENPKAYKYIGQVEHGVNGMVDDEDKINDAFVNDFAKDWVQTPFSVTNPDGREEPVLWNPNLPFMDLGKIPDVTHPIESMKELFTQSNPLLKVPIEQAINKNVFFDSPIVKEDDTSSAALAKRAEHILSQLSLYNTGKGFLTKNGTDLGLHTTNTLSGVKMLSYDYDKYKAIKIQEMLKEMEEENK